MHQLILVSQSPRRQKLLTDAGYKFRNDLVKVSEIIDENLNLPEAIMAVARQKAEAYVNGLKSSESQDFLVLTADTVVAYSNDVFGKPKNNEEAFKILSFLSGKTHSVITGLCVYDSVTCQFHQQFSETKVKFHELSKKQIEDYIKTGEPMDKAGAYGIQGRAKVFVKEFLGEWDNVVGLPMKTFEKLVNENGWVIDKK